MLFFQHIFEILNCRLHKIINILFSTNGKHYNSKTSCNILLRFGTSIHIIWLIKKIWNKVGVFWWKIPENHKNYTYTHLHNLTCLKYRRVIPCQINQWSPGDPLRYWWNFIRIIYCGQNEHTQKLALYSMSFPKYGQLKLAPDPPLAWRDCDFFQLWKLITYFLPMFQNLI